jgi:hypothetical protein
MAPVLLLHIYRTVIQTSPPTSYDFDLRSGNSETGLRACTYQLDFRDGLGQEKTAWVEVPSHGTEWRLVELRPVSEGTFRRLPSDLHLE